LELTVGECSRFDFGQGSNCRAARWCPGNYLPDRPTLILA
jgi:hypothetical protein